MAERRMFSKSIIDSDMFLDMPLSAQALYFHLSMRADDDGFVNNPKKIMRMIGSDEDSIKLLSMKNFIIPFESGVVVIKHWRMHNYIQKDRYKETTCVEEKRYLGMKENGEYSLLEEPMEKPVTTLDTNCVQDVSSLDTQDRLGKSKDSLGKSKSKSKDSKEIGKSKSKSKARTDERTNAAGGFEVIVSSYTADDELHEAIFEFVKMRQANGKKLTDRALQLILAKLDKLANNDSEKVAILNQSIENCWQGVFPLKDGYEPKQENPKPISYEEVMAAHIGHTDF